MGDSFFLSSTSAVWQTSGHVSLCGRSWNSNALFRILAFFPALSHKITLFKIPVSSVRKHFNLPLVGDWLIDCTFLYSDCIAEQDNVLWFVCPSPSSPMLVCFFFFSLPQKQDEQGFLILGTKMQYSNHSSISFWEVISLLLLRDIVQEQAKKVRWILSGKGNFLLL